MDKSILPNTTGLKPLFLAKKLYIIKHANKKDVIKKYASIK